MPEHNQKTVFLDILIKTLSLVFPLVILIYIILNLEVAVLQKILQTADLRLFLLGLVVSPVVIAIGAFRWYIGLNHFIDKNIPYNFASIYYWIGLAIGKFLPGSITWDIYRATIAGKKFGKYKLQIYTIILEKISALISAVVVIIILIPLINNTISMHDLTEQLLSGLSPLGIKEYDLSFIIPLILTGLLLTGVIGWWGINKFKKNAALGFEDLFKPLKELGLIGPLIISSIGIYLVMAVMNHLFFFSLHTPLPFGIHLFLMPILAILLLLPISFGGLGIREGVFILFYGFFEVPMETALLASLMNLVATSLNAGIGGLIMLRVNYLNK